MPSSTISSERFRAPTKLGSAIAKKVQIRNSARSSTDSRRREKRADMRENGIQSDKLRMFLTESGRHQSLLGRLPPGELTGERTFPEHQDAVAHPEEFGQFGGHQNDGFPRIGQPIHDLVD